MLSNEFLDYYFIIAMASKQNKSAARRAGLDPTVAAWKGEERYRAAKAEAEKEAYYKKEAARINAELVAKERAKRPDTAFYYNRYNH